MRKAEGGSARWAAVALTCASVATLSAQPRELIERTLAIVGGQVITLSDTRAAVSLGLIDVGSAADVADRAIAKLVERELVLREVQRYAPPDPTEAAIEARLATVRQRFPDALALAQVFAFTGFSETRLRDWVRDDLRLQAYLAQRFAAAGIPTEQEISMAFTARRGQFDAAGTSFEQAVPLLREELAAARRQELIADWIADLRRRTEIVLLK